MTISLSCTRCERPITRPGALVFSSPIVGKENTVRKYHVCVECERMLMWFLAGKPLANVAAAADPMTRPTSYVDLIREALDSHDFEEAHRLREEAEEAGVELGWVTQSLLDARETWEKMPADVRAATMASGTREGVEMAVRLKARIARHARANRAAKIAGGDHG